MTQHGGYTWGLHLQVKSTTRGIYGTILEKPHHPTKLQDDRSEKKFSGEAGLQSKLGWHHQTLELLVEKLLWS
jgi:hypothetical protein